MHAKPRFSAQDALDMMVANTPPLDFGGGLPVYRAAIKRIAKVDVHGLITSDLSAVPMDLAFVELLCERLDRTPLDSKAERRRQNDFLSRLRTIARRLHAIPLVQTSRAWEDFVAAVSELIPAYGLTEHDLIPIRSTLRQAAVEAGIEPFQITADWLASMVQNSTRKRRDSLIRAAKHLDRLWEELPPHLRPCHRIGQICVTPNMRKSQPLPPRISEQLEAYIAQRVRGTMMPGLTGEVQVKEGIKPDQSTNIYRQAIGWLYDTLCLAGILDPADDLQMTDIARLDWVSKVSIEALAHYEADEGENYIFPWKPIQPKTIYNRANSLVLIFGNMVPDFLKQSVSVINPETLRSIEIDAIGLSKLLRAQFTNEMTEAHRTFCRRLVAEESRQRLLLNMHMICWSEAQTRWKNYSEQGQTERSQTINLCILATALALVVNIPFRARTVVEMTVGGAQPDLSLPKGSRSIELHVAPKRMKVPKQFDALLEDSKESRPRQIFDWFAAGPRQELLKNRALLRNPSEKLLFCGIGTARYNSILSGWTEEIGMRMTTHLFRHAIASVLINCCGASVEDVAGLLGNTVATVEHNYAFYDRIRLRGKALQKLADHRQSLREAHHPGRRRKS